MKPLSKQLNSSVILSQESLLALSKVREEVDLEKGQMAWGNKGQDKDLELCIRAKNNAWVIARITKGKELYMVLEKANETVLYASDAVEKFSNRYAVFILCFPLYQMLLRLQRPIQRERKSRNKN